MDINQAIESVKGFQGASLTESISDIETAIQEMGIQEVQNFCSNRGVDDEFMAAALSIKKLAGQINTIIHAAGILRSLQDILEPGEVIEYVSLGAGNTGRKFDLTTNKRVAEYKFIDWQGGAESIRQNSLFKDFFGLAEHETDKKKFLYVVGDEFPLKFFNGGRKLSSVLSRQPKILMEITEKYGAGIERVCHYYDIKKHEVKICDVTNHIGRGNSR